MSLRTPARRAASITAAVPSTCTRWNVWESISRLIPAKCATTSHPSKARASDSASVTFTPLRRDASTTCSSG